MRRVVSVSLGSSKRDKVADVDFLGHRYRIERRGTDGSTEKFRALVDELDGQVDAIGVGGADLYVFAGKRRYAFREVHSWVRGVQRSFVGDGSRLKNTLERHAVQSLQASGRIDFRSKETLLVMAVDRFGMAEALAETGGRVVFGDLMFGLGLPVPVRRLATVHRLARVLLPIITRLPIQWVYPTGEAQERRQPKFGRHFASADIWAGDWHYLRRHAPDAMGGKTLLTQSVRQADIEWLRACGAAQLAVTTPWVGGETFATNVNEALMAAHLQKPALELTDAEIGEFLREAGWGPTVIDLTSLPERVP